MTPGGRVAVVSAACAAFVLSPCAPAPADTTDHLRVEVVTSEGPRAISGPLFDVANVGSGASLLGTVRLSNQSEASGELTIDLGNLRDFEGGCVEPEIEAGDTTCDADDGEMNERLVATLTVTGKAVYSGGLSGIRNLTLNDSLLPGASTEMTLQIDLQQGGDAWLQSDGVTFDLRWTLTGETGEVLGEQATAPGQIGGDASAPTTAAIPFSVPAGIGDRPVLFLSWFAGLAVLLGSLMTTPAWARRRRGRHVDLS